MKKIMFWISVGLNLQLAAQSFESDLQKVYKNFIEVQEISYNTKYVLRTTHSENSPIISEITGKYIKSDGKSLSMLDGRATLVTQEEIILIDQEEKRINVKRVKQKKSSPTDFIDLLKTGSASTDHISRSLSNDKSLLTYDVFLKTNVNSPVKHYKLTIDVKTNLIHSMTLFYSKALSENEDYNVTGKEIPRLDIFFYNFNSDKKKNEIQPTYYYTKINNKLIPTQNFKGYAIKEVF